MKSLLRALPYLLIALLLCVPAIAQDESVRPGINKPYENADLQGKIKQFEGENRDIARNRDAIVKACNLKPGLDVADVGAGTGLFTRLFAPKVGPKGKVYAVDITKKFLDHVEKTCKEKELDNVVIVHCTDQSTELPDASVDLAFNCDTYHHFEYPFKTLASIHRALRPDGQLILIDFEKDESVNPKWVIAHIRADKKTVIEEVTAAGFKLIEEVDLMKTQFVLRFEKK
ncbi:MAG: methyltransferase domain-containing protein [Candidatus Nealsonbacteria bacterium]|nr:methyltransferase domain-containing protein [Candidatus Nealsonbacteria bacterium]